MRIPAKADYAVRALVELAARSSGPVTAPVKAESIARAQGIPLRFLLAILGELKRASLVHSQRGQEGGYVLAVAPELITVADVIRVVDGPLASVQGQRPEQLSYPGPAEPLRDVWVAVRASLRDVLETTTIADIAAGRLPDRVRELTADETAWTGR